MSKGKLIGIIVGVVCIVVIIIVVATLQEAADYETARLFTEATTELHQAQTAIIACMADGETGLLTTPSGDATADWSGEAGVITVVSENTTYDAADYTYGPFRAKYTVTNDGTITDGNPDIDGGWGSSIVWNPADNCWNSAG